MMLVNLQDSNGRLFALAVAGGGVASAGNVGDSRRDACGDNRSSGDLHVGV